MTFYPHIIAHRCGGALAPENSLAGLAIAARLGCRGVEFDVMLSADGVPLLIHDESLERTTTGSGKVAELSAERIRSHDNGGPHHQAFASERIPTLDEALNECQALGLWANVEIKPAQGHEEATGHVVAAAVAAHAHGSRCLFSSFSGIAIEAALLSAPRVPRALLFGALPDDWRQQVQTFAAVGVHLNAAKVKPAQLAALREAGLRVACYTVNRREDVATLFSLGVDAVFTDRPDRWSAEEM